MNELSYQLRSIVAIEVVIKIKNGRAFHNFEPKYRAVLQLYRDVLLSKMNR